MKNKCKCGNNKEKFAKRCLRCYLKTLAGKGKPMSEENKKPAEQKSVEQKPVEQRPELETAGYKPRIESIGEDSKSVLLEVRNKKSNILIKKYNIYKSIRRLNKVYCRANGWKLKLIFTSKNAAIRGQKLIVNNLTHTI